MSYLLSISIGPVQEFIAAARRTADLKAGSDLLVGVVQRAADAVAHHGELVFPVEPSHRGANKILAVVEEPDAALKAARCAAESEGRDSWDAFCKALPKETPSRAEPVENLILVTIGKEQVAHFLEIAAAWWPVVDADDGNQYSAARREVELLLAGRKVVRDFAPPTAYAGLPKSPLDPSRDCVAKTRPNLAVIEELREQPLWLKARETLDAISLVKRYRGYRAGTVPSTSLMAVRSIYQEMKAKSPSDLDRLERIARDAGSGVDLGDLMFPGRTDDADLRLLEAEDREAIPQLRRKLLRAAGWSEAPPYYAILVADGDRMGALLGQANVNNKRAHQDLSRRLHSFGDQVLAIVEGDHDGYLVYCGGDDLLALLPIHRAIDCAAALANALRMTLAPLKPMEGGTLSAGVAIVHAMESLQQGIEHARAAERAAKGPRNALAVAYHPRGGSPVTFVRGWDDDCVDQWHEWIQSFRDGGIDGEEGLSRGVPYELREMARDLKAASEASRAGGDTLHERVDDLARAEADRILKRKKGGGSHPLPGWVRTLADVDGFADLLLIARVLATYGGAA